MFHKQPWVAAFSLVVKDWETGGAVTDYDRQFYDIYVVEARARDEAKLLGQARRRQQRLTGKQHAFLVGLLREVDIFDKLPTDWIEIVSPEEQRLSRRLQAKGLLTIRGDVEGPVTINSRPFEVQLLPDSLNFQERNPDALKAYHREARAHCAPAATVLAPRRPRLRS